MDADSLSQRHRDFKESILQGVYVYGKSEKRTSIIGGKARRSYGSELSRQRWFTPPSAKFKQQPRPPS
jgi:hypothetical protein